MKAQTIEYFDGDQKLIGELINNQQTNQPAIILFHAFEGRGSFTVDYAKNLAAKGYAVFVADMYGNAETTDTLDGCFKLITPFLQDRSLVRRRAILAYEALSHQNMINKNKIGAMGFCFGGMCVLELARSGAKLQAAVSVHGVLAKSDLQTHQMKAKILALHGYKDPQVPPERLQGFAQEMETAKVDDWSFVFFGHAKHSFTDPKTGTFDPVQEKEIGREYNEVAAQRSFQYAVDFFNECLMD